MTQSFDKFIAEFREKMGSRHKTALTDFRYAVYPDADKDLKETMLANYGCHGFEYAISYIEEEHLPEITKLIEAAQIMKEALPQIAHTSTEFAWSRQEEAIEALSKIEELMG